MGLHPNSFYNIESNETDLEIQHPIFNYDSIVSMIYNPLRFQDTAIVITDYCMPGQLNGLEVCNEIKSLPYRKILLTGNADLKTAVNAFNNKLIDRFIDKSVSNLIGELNTLIQEEIEEYFEKISFSIPGWDTFEKLKSKEQKEVFFKVLDDNNIVEYYQIEKNVYLMMTAEGEINWLVFQSNNKQIEYIDIAKDYNERGITENLEKRTHLVYLFSHYENHLPVSEWKNYMFKIERKIPGFSYSLIKNRYFSLDSEKIKSYNSYLTSVI